MEISLSQKDLDYITSELIKKLEKKVLESSINSATWEALKEHGLEHARKWYATHAPQEGVRQFIDERIKKEYNTNLRSVIRDELQAILKDVTLRQEVRRQVAQYAVEAAQQIARDLQADMD